MILVCVYTSCLGVLAANDSKGPGSLVKIVEHNEGFFTFFFKSEQVNPARGRLEVERSPRDRRVLLRPNVRARPPRRSHEQLGETGLHPARQALGSRFESRMSSHF